MSFVLELKIAEDLARKAGKIALKHQNSGILRYKENSQGPLTQADLLADRCILEGLQKHFPQDRIITEESFSLSQNLPQEGRTWFVDPIDGTSNYAAGGSEYVIMIGLAINGESRLGVVFEPATQTLWKATPQKAERISKKGILKLLNIRNTPFCSKKPILVLSHSVPSFWIEFLKQKLPELQIIQKSSVGLKIMLIVEGKADFYVASAKHIKLWDTCAPTAILNASGGLISSISGQALQFWGNISHGIEIFATRPHAQVWFSNRIQGVIESWITLRKTERYFS